MMTMMIYKCKSVFPCFLVSFPSYYIRRNNTFINDLQKNPAKIKAKSAIRKNKFRKNQWKLTIRKNKFRKIRSFGGLDPHK